LMMANISWLQRRTGYSLSFLVVIGLSMLPSASCLYCNTPEGKFISTSRWDLSFKKHQLGKDANLNG